MSAFVAWQTINSCLTWSKVFHLLCMSSNFVDVHMYIYVKDWQKRLSPIHFTIRCVTAVGLILLLFAFQTLQGSLHKAFIYKSTKDSHSCKHCLSLLLWSKNVGKCHSQTRIFKEIFIQIFIHSEYSTHWSRTINCLLISKIYWEGDQVPSSGSLIACSFMSEFFRLQSLIAFLLILLRHLETTGMYFWTRKKCLINERKPKIPS